MIGRIASPEGSPHTLVLVTQRSTLDNTLHHFNPVSPQPDASNVRTSCHEIAIVLELAVRHKPYQGCDLSELSVYCFESGFNYRW